MTHPKNTRRIQTIPDKTDKNLLLRLLFAPQGRADQVPASKAPNPRNASEVVMTAVREQHVFEAPAAAVSEHMKLWIFFCSSQLGAS